MMRQALAIETSGRAGSVALVADDRVISEETFPQGLRHAAELVPMIDRLTHQQGWRPQDIQVLYISIGPGSFTGLRIGVTFAKALSFATGARLVAVPTAQVLTHNAPSGWINSIIVLDAKRGQIFTARFANEHGRPVEKEPAHLDTLTAMLHRSPRPVHLMGEGIPYHRPHIPPDDPAIIITPEESWHPQASIVARLGMAKAAAGDFTDPQELTPLYLRLPEAEEKRLIHQAIAAVQGTRPGE